MDEKTVCVTGASGFIGSWLVKRLLEHGYRVRATVRDPDDNAKTSHLRALPGAAERLWIGKGDLLDEHCFDVAVSGCEGLFHLASPVFVETDDPENDLIKPAVQGTLNVLNACAKSTSVRRVVYTSTNGTAVPLTEGDELPEQVLDESCWTSVELCMQKKFRGWGYTMGKTLAEQKAFEFAKENNIDLVSIIPVLVLGPFLAPQIPRTVKYALSLVTGASQNYPSLKRKCYVHVDDVARAHIYVYENPEAQGRYICSAKEASIDELAEMLRQGHPELKVATELGSGGKQSPVFSSEKLIKLGFNYKYNLQDMFDHAIQCCKEKCLL